MPFLTPSERFAWLATVEPDALPLLFGSLLADLENDYGLQPRHGAIVLLRAISEQEARERSHAGTVGSLVSVPLAR